MSCAHPASVLHVDRARGTVTCALCGEVVTDQQFELDPLFSRGDRPAANARNALRALGAPRPMRTTVLQLPASQRPSIDAARRGIAAIARQMEISSDLVEMATAVYKLAVGINAVTGARTCILCACLYAVCRREGTSHMLYDFADASKESPLVILHYMKLICHATNTTVPPLDSSVLLFRLAEHLKLGDEQVTQNICICALKILRMMNDSWINIGRRPLGLCAAALIVACDHFKMGVDSREVCAFVRLTGSTLQQRLTEFWNTPAAKLENVDDYNPSIVETQLPPNVRIAGHNEGAMSYREELLALSQLYYELIAEAKVSTPPTPERCEKWKRFVKEHCRINNVEPKQEVLDLTLLTPKEQLVRLGFPQAVPVPYEAASQFQEKVSKIGYLRAAVEPQLGILRQKCGRKVDKGNSFDRDSTASHSTGAAPATVGRSAVNASPACDGGATSPFVPMTQQLDLMEEFLSREEELTRLDDLMQSPLLLAADADAKTTKMIGNGGTVPLTEVDEDDDEDDDAVLAAERAECRDRPHAKPWEVIVLPPLKDDSTADIADYIVYDLEQRLRAEKVLEERLGKAAIARGRAATPAEVLARLRHRTGTKRRRVESAQETQAAPTLQSALERALKGRGASAIDVSGLDSLIPGLNPTHDASEVGSSVNDEWPVD